MENIDLDGVAISTRNIVYKAAAILKVSHDDDGVWQFLDGSSEPDENDAVVISLGTILNIDPTLKEILNLPLGSNAFRRDEGSTWIVRNHN
ncbi:MAG: DUF2185 domain-containing protein [Bacteroidetes bacterium]|nr:DUF2185 domain-containing protein [Bacteroidota bacterium]